MSHLGRHLLRIEDDVVLHDLVVRKCDERVHLSESFYVHFVRYIRLETHRVHIVLLYV